MQPDATYIIIDLPEMLFWSAVFLRLNNPDAGIYLYDTDSFAAGSIGQIVADNKFVLLPHYLIDRLKVFSMIDVAINMLSMQEMTEVQVRTYCEFLTKCLRGWFYSENYANHKYNAELGHDLYDIFTDYFETIPKGKLSEHQELASKPWQPYLYLMTPKSAPAPLKPLRRALKGAN